MRGVLVVVEDYESTLRALEREIKRAFEFVGCATVRATLDYLEHLDEQGRAQIVGLVIDVVLPDGWGLDLVESLRPQLPAATVAVYTARADLAPRVKELGASLIVKPDLDVLRQFLHRLAARRVEQKLDLSEAVKLYGARYLFQPHETLLLAELGRGTPLNLLEIELETPWNTLKYQLEVMREKSGCRSIEEMVQALLRVANTGHIVPADTFTCGSSPPAGEPIALSSLSDRPRSAPA